jgi:Flp pilus assembly pilin Flp
MRPADGHRFVSFLNDEQGQELIEYTLPIAFVNLASAARFPGTGGSL